MNYISMIHAILRQESWSQSQLAQQLGVTFAALNRWLNGHAKPRLDKVAAIHKLYKEKVGYPSITDVQIQQAVQRGEKFKEKNLWNILGKESDLQDEFLLEHTFNSTSIEGTTFNKKESETVIFKKGVIPNKTLVEHLEVTNHAAVLRGIFRRKYPAGISEILIKKLHQDLMHGIRTDTGEYSKYPRGIRGVEITLTHPEDIPDEMGRLVEEWRGTPTKKNIQEIAHFHWNFELIHPFGDGNGRVGRLLMAMQCLQENYPPIVIENSRKTEYYDVLAHAQRKSEHPFVLFLLDEMERTSKILKKYL